VHVDEAACHRDRELLAGGALGDAPADVLGDGELAAPVVRAFGGVAEVGADREDAVVVWQPGARARSRRRQALLEPGVVARDDGQTWRRGRARSTTWRTSPSSRPTTGALCASSQRSHTRVSTRLTRDSERVPRCWPAGVHSRLDGHQQLCASSVGRERSSARSGPPVKGREGGRAARRATADHGAELRTNSRPRGSLCAGVQPRPGRGGAVRLGGCRARRGGVRAGRSRGADGPAGAARRCQGSRVPPEPAEITTGLLGDVMLGRMVAIGPKASRRPGLGRMRGAATEFARLPR